MTTLTNPSSAPPADTGPLLTEAAAEGWVPKTCFKTGPPERVGIELEFLLRDPRDHPRDTGRLAPEVATTAAASGLHGAVTIEPGGQVEISSPPAAGPAAAFEVTAHDVRALADAARTHGLELATTALDPLRPPRRVLDHPRYAAMEAHLARWGFPGRTMMCSTTSVQVNLESGRAGRPGDVARRWHLLHLLRAPLVAAFGNSPIRLGRATGWKSTRQAVWLALDPGRTAGPCAAPGGSGPPPSDDPPGTWTRWALDTELLLVRRDGAPWTAPPCVTFRDWLRGGEAVVPGRPAPTLDDLAYHLTTLFPPVRARGHLEVRYLDQQPGRFWRVPAAVLLALTEDDAAGDAALAAAEPVAERVIEAARRGMDQPDLARAAVAVLDAAAGALRARPAWRSAAEPVEAYLERWTLRGRSPADDVLDPRTAEPTEEDTPC